jgi:hypothetical protein
MLTQFTPRAPAPPSAAWLAGLRPPHARKWLAFNGESGA